MLLQTNEITDNKFDYAITSFVLHEMSQKERLTAVQQMKAAAHTLIIADYTAPQPKNMLGFFNTLTELLGGPSHFKGFRTFVNNVQ